MMRTPLQVYREKQDAGLLQEDPEQEQTVFTLEKLFQTLLDDHLRPKGWLERIAEMGGSKSPSPKGIYIYGDVGRGKSMLMDLFYGCLPRDMKKRRIHFHAFMIEVHDYFHARRSADEASLDVDGLITPLASLIHARAHVLCFDEFHVTDVADAMILGRLFTALFDKGVVVVTTSNWAPDRLYENGLQRDRFLPFIELLKSKCDVIALDSDTDYRRQFLSKEGTYFYPLGSNTDQKASQVFAKLTQGQKPHRKILSVKGRKIVINHCAQGVARVTFAQMCEQPHGAEDYIALSNEFHTVFLEHVPKLTYDRRNEAKRLMIMIDALYEAGTNLIVTADAPAEELYHGHDHKEEFKRTVSRLLEMQNRD